MTRPVLVVGLSDRATAAHAAEIKRKLEEHYGVDVIVIAGATSLAVVHRDDVRIASAEPITPFNREHLGTWNGGR